MDIDLAILILVTIVWFVLFIIFVVRRKKSPSVVLEQSPVPSPVPRPVPVQIQSPVANKLSFSSAKIIDGNGTNFYYMSEGYLSFRNMKNIDQWMIDKPLSYTHAKINNLIFKFTNPNSSDSSGFVVDEFGNKINPQPASQFSNKIDFGFFI